MLARHSIALTAAAFLAFTAPVYAAPEGLGEAPVASAPVQATAPAPAAKPAPTRRAAAPTAIRPATTHSAKPVVRAARPAVRPVPVRSVTRTTRPAFYQVASSAPVGCQSITCMGGVILLGVGF
jgi:hypothetical protein